MVVPSEERDNMMTEDRGDIMMMVVVPTHLSTTINESSL